MAVCEYMTITHCTIMNMTHHNVSLFQCCVDARMSPPPNCVQAIFRARARMLTFRGSRCAPHPKKKKHCKDHSNEQYPVYSACLKSSSVFRKKKKNLDILQEEERIESLIADTLAVEGGKSKKTKNTNPPPKKLFAIKSRKLLLPQNKFSREDKAKSFGLSA